MACLKTGDFKRILDEPGTPASAHLFSCKRCQRALAGFAERERRVDGWLSSLAVPDEEIQPDVRTALARLRGRDEMRVRPGVAWWASPSRYVSVAVHAGFFALLMFGATSPS